MLASATAVIVFVILAIPALGVGAYLLVQEALVRVESGELGLVVRRGKPTGRALLPGTHFVRPFGRMTIQNYPARELSYRTTRDAVSEDDGNPTTDPPVGVVLGDLPESALRYQQIEAWRSLVDRWDGRIGIPGIVTGRSAADSGTPDGGAA